MLVAYFLFSLLYFNCKSENMYSLIQSQEQQLMMCIIDIVEKYFSEQKALSFVDIKSDDDGILKAIHSSTVTALIYRQVTMQSSFRHQGYLIIAKTATEFTNHFKCLLEEPTWNPLARFLIVVRFKKSELRKIFDVLLKHHVINVVVVNGTNNAELYTYNPFDNYACGKYYENIVSFGLCLQTKKNLYPEKLVTGLRNCTLLASVGDQAPYSIRPPVLSEKMPGTEQYLFKLMAEIEKFNVIFSYEYDTLVFSVISANMNVTGPMAKLQNNETDVMFGGTTLVSSKADAFTYLYGHLDFDDELDFVVKTASYVPTWKDTYLEFKPIVWCLLFVVYLSYCILMILLLRSKDKTEIMLKLLHSLFCHGWQLRERMTVKYIFLVWVWYAYIINSIYQSNLVSLTTNPMKELQVSNEMDLVTNHFEPCISPAVIGYIYSDTNRYPPMKHDCPDMVRNLKLVSRTKYLFTLVRKSVHKYYKTAYNDKYGRSKVFRFRRPYAKLIISYFFYKGFPISDKMQKNAIRLREVGLVVKSLRDHYYSREIKYHFHNKEFETRFVLPWYIYVVGCTAAIIVFIFELLFVHYKKRKNNRLQWRT